MKKNGLNSTGTNTQILDSEPLKEMKTYVEKCLADYLSVFATPESGLSLYLVGSWLNMSKKGEGHHKHGHPNSVVSGTIYINVDENTDTIRFYKDKHAGFNLFSFDSGTKHFFSLNSFNLPVSNATIVLFPSYITHEVPKVVGDHIRTTIAFNTYIKGVISTIVGQSLTLN